jgi:hypothetical protein
MTRAALALVAMTVVLSAALRVLGVDLPGEAWGLVGGAVGVTIRRPGDTSPEQVARALEASEITAL